MLTLTGMGQALTSWAHLRAVSYDEDLRKTGSARVQPDRLGFRCENPNRARTTLGLPRTSRSIVRCSFAFPLQAHGLRHRLRFSKLISSPAGASVCASPGPHGARRKWGSFIPDYMPGY